MAVAFGNLVFVGWDKNLRRLKKMKLIMKKKAFMDELSKEFKKILKQGLITSGAYVGENYRAKSHVSAGGRTYTGNAPYTVRRKGFNRPWFHTGAMAKAISKKKVKDDHYFIGITNLELAWRASVVEYGCDIMMPNGFLIRIPPRPLFQRTLEYCSILAPKMLQVDLQKRWEATK